MSTAFFAGRRGAWSMATRCLVVALLVHLGTSAFAAQPQRVTLVGSLQQTLGCEENWSPDCMHSALHYDDEDGVWQASFLLPAGSYEYKVALNGSWDVNYGAGAVLNGGNLSLTLDAARSVKFYFRHGSNWIADDVNQLIPVLAGNFQRALGCTNDWDPACLRGWLEDPSGQGIYAADLALPAGSFETKVAMNESWTLNYGADGIVDGANIAFDVDSACGMTRFQFDGLSNHLHIDAAPAASQPESVTIAGSLQQALGCEDNWNPACSLSDLELQPDSAVWRGEFLLSVGEYEYKAALNGSWERNYGAGAQANGANIPLQLSGEQAVRFYYSHASNWVMDSVNTPLVVAVGDFQQHLGCSGDWQPDCLAAWLQDPAGHGVYRHAVRLPAGSYQAKVAFNESWEENYGANGERDGANIAFDVAEGCGLTWFQFDADTRQLSISDSAVAPRGNLAEARAHFIDANTLVWGAGDDDAQYTLHASAEAELRLTAEGIVGGESLTLQRVPGGLSEQQRQRFPRLANLPALRLPALQRDELTAMLRGQLAVSVSDASGRPVDATALQIPGVLDTLFTTDLPLGPVVRAQGVELHLWAPTARAVHLLLYADSDPATTATRHSMAFDNDSGIWSVTGTADWKQRYYQFEVEVYVPGTGRIEINQVTDPYSVSLAADSTRSQLVDLADPAWMPAGFLSSGKPPLAAHVDSIIYELHVRDFSIRDFTVPAEERGRYAAFARRGSQGMQHLQRLAGAGFTHVHLLPVFDQANIPEREQDRQEVPWEELQALPADSAEQQARIAAIRDLDGFNWGYDPWHFTVPEGSYATDPDGPWRIREFRQMVQALNQSGLRVIKDVVYNHTNAAGQNAKSVLDRIVPGYYHRLNAEGNVEQSSCCPNTASEHAMMERLMIDSVLTWAQAYRIDGFRFDLMGHHSRDNLLRLRAALDELNLREHGVDGRAILLYGEGWNFGEVANDARFVQATQANMAGTGIGSFSDRSRDGARGGNPFGDRRQQGFLSGLFLDPNGFQGSGDGERAELLHISDWLRIGLAADLRDYQLQNAQGDWVRADEIDYFGQRAGYTGHPAEHIKYTEAHDNETLFDALMLKLPVDTSMAQRVRVQNLAHSLMLMGQGIPFFHAGQEILRSKSGDRDSYNAGDWFNLLDWSLQDNGWGRGLPSAEKNQDAWPLLAPLLADPGNKPHAAHQQAALNHVLEMTRVRRSSRLFRLPDAEHIHRHLLLHNSGPQQLPGLLVLELADEQGAVERRWRRIVGLINARPDEASYMVDSLQQRALHLHPVLAASSDPLLRSAHASDGSFSVPGRSAAVFVEPRPSSEQLQLLQADLQQALTAGQIAAARARSLQNLLELAGQHLARGQRQAAGWSLSIFRSQLLLSQMSGTVDAQAALRMIEHSGVLMDSL